MARIVARPRTANAVFLHLLRPALPFAGTRHVRVSQPALSEFQTLGLMFGHGSLSATTRAGNSKNGAHPSGGTRARRSRLGGSEEKPITLGVLLYLHTFSSSLRPRKQSRGRSGHLPGC